MARLMRSVSAEFLKLRATRTGWMLAALMLILAAGAAGLFAAMFGPLGMQSGAMVAPIDPRAAAGLVYSAPTSLLYVIPLVLGALGVSGEYRNRTLAGTFTAEPRRGIVLAAKALVLFCAGALLGLLGALGALGVGALVTGAGGGDAFLGEAATWGIALRTVPAMGLWALIGLGLGILVRSQAVVIVIALGFSQFVQPILRMVSGLWDWSAAIGKFLPGAATDAFIGSGIFTSMGSLDPSLAGLDPAILSRGWGGVVLAATALLLLGLGWLLRWRSDLD
ncbi:ABC transporter permease [Mycetocola spongiae]|uniref:ABC transporter permease n=1 Tax=Mycetocola spongiae TaxID=2859226 RepID=UPI001CF19909|nr:ABC transporter permease [Mycetocola spongiae]UCR88661.1 ABC transporter permease [Mycetocola spongiae]